MTEIAIALAVWFYLAGTLIVFQETYWDVPNRTRLARYAVVTALWPAAALVSLSLIMLAYIKQWWRYNRARRKAKPWKTDTKFQCLR